MAESRCSRKRERAVAERLNILRRLIDAGELRRQLATRAKREKRG